MSKEIIAILIIFGVALTLYTLGVRRSIYNIATILLMLFVAVASFFAGIIGLMVRIWQSI
jgi:hypothetical protein